MYNIMASNLNSNNLVMDIFEPGFFHLWIDFEDENSETQKLIDVWISRQEALLDALDKTKAPAPQTEAIKNAIAVFMYKGGKGSQSAISYLEKVLEETSVNKASMNTISNLIYMYDEIKGEETHTERISQLKSIMQKGFDDIQVGRAMCERAYFYEQHKFNIQFSIASSFWKEGIAKGADSGMSQIELSVWKFYLCKSKGNILQHMLYNEKESNLFEKQKESFSNFLDSFDDFYTNDLEYLSFYKSRLTVESLLKIVIEKKKLQVLPEFDTIFYNSLLGDLHKHFSSSLQDALEMSPDDYKVLLCIGRIYLNLAIGDKELADQQFLSEVERLDKAESYIDKSLHIESEWNVFAHETLLAIYCKKAKYYFEKKKMDKVKEYQNQAYRQGKELDRRNMPLGSALEMANICYHIAADKSRFVWFVPHDKQMYIEEAMAYNSRVLDTKIQYYMARAHKQLSECLWMTKDYDQAIEHQVQSIETSLDDKAIMNIDIFLGKVPFYLNRRELREPKRDMLISNISSNFLMVWQKKSKCTDTEFKKVFHKFAEKMKQKDNSRNIIALLNSLQEKYTTESSDFLRWFCNFIVEDNTMSNDVTTKCQEILVTNK